MLFTSCTPPAATGERNRDSINAEPRPNMEALAPPPKDTLPQAITPDTSIRYTYFLLKDSGRARMQAYTPVQHRIIYALNRIDGSSMLNLDTVLVPSAFPEDLRAISPFPQQLPSLRDVSKLVLFSYPIQAFAAYERGVLQRWGPVSMGRKETPTPEGLFFASQKDEEVISRYNDEWSLKWNVRLGDSAGTSWHQSVLPGKPVSHASLRLLERDAEWLYNWVDIQASDSTAPAPASGTPTIIFGQYAWGRRRPWVMLLNNPAANNLSAEQLQQMIQPYLQRILAAQQSKTTAASGSGTPRS